MALSRMKRSYHVSNQKIDIMNLPGRSGPIQRRFIMKERFRRLFAHTIYECKYHLIFCPKSRYRILKDDIGEYSRQQVYQLCK